MMDVVELEHCGFDTLHSRHVWFAAEGRAEHAAMCEGYRLYSDWDTPLPLDFDDEDKE